MREEKRAKDMEEGARQFLNMVEAPGTDAGAIETIGGIKTDFRISQLGPSNYPVWKRQVWHVLSARGMEKALEDGSVSQETKRMVMAILFTALDADNARLVLDCTSPVSLWQTIARYHENKTTSERQALIRKLHTYKIKSAATMSSDLAAIQTLASQINSLGAAIPEDVVAGIIMEALPKSFEQWLDSYLLLSQESRSLEHLVANLIVKARNMVKNEGHQESVALFARNPVSRQRERGPDKREKRTCHFCHKVGHIKKNCFKYKASQKVSPGASNQPAQSAQPVQSTQDRDGVTLMVASCLPARDIWVADSGASHHMSNHREWFTEFHDISEAGRKVIIGDGSQLRVLGCGTILTRQARIEGCLYVPELWTNLISLGTCHEKGLSWVAEVTGVCALKRGETRVIEGRWTNRTYVLSLDVVVPTMANMAATVTDWHRKFAHIAPSTLERMRKLGACEGLEVVPNNQPPKCMDCALGKCTRASHSSQRHSKSQSGWPSAPFRHNRSNEMCEPRRPQVFCPLPRRTLELQTRRVRLPQVRGGRSSEALD